MHVSCHRKSQAHVNSLLLPASHSLKHKPQSAEVSHCFILQPCPHLSRSWVVSAFSYYWKSCKILGTTQGNFTAPDSSKSRLRQGAHEAIQLNVSHCFPCRVVRVSCLFILVKRRFRGGRLSLVFGFIFTY